PRRRCRSSSSPPSSRTTSSSARPTSAARRLRSKTQSPYSLLDPRAAPALPCSRDFRPQPVGLAHRAWREPARTLNRASTARPLDPAPRGAFFMPATEIATDLLPPLGAYLSLRESAAGSFLLESVERGRLGRYSFVGAGSQLVTFEEAETAREAVVGY